MNSNSPKATRNRSREEINKDTSSPTLRPAQAAHFLGIGLSTLWAYTNRPDFPKPIKYGPKVTTFKKSELIDWRDARQAG